MKIIGFTGTRYGMTDVQKREVANLVRQLQPTEAHHGVCIGADAEFHWIVRREFPACQTIGHPGPDEAMQDADVRADCDKLLLPKTHFARNRDIVEIATSGMIGAPHEKPLPHSGGTVYTVSYSWKRGRPTFVVWPDGDVLFTTKESK